MPTESPRILGVRVDPVTMARALDRAMAYLDEPRLHQVVTVNPEFVVLAQRDAAFRRTLNAADLALPDGIGLLLAARLLGRPLPARVAGVDFVRQLGARLAERGERPFLLGAAPGVAAKAAAILERDLPGLRVAGTYAGSPRPEDAPAILERIAASGARVLLVAYGAPRQDLWIRTHRDALGGMGIRLASGVGGSFDFIAGVLPRAPRGWQRLGLEWLYRWRLEPWRWRRMIRLPLFLAWALAAGRG